MKKNIIKTFFATAMVATTILTTGISAQAAEVTEAQTQTTKAEVKLTEASKAALKTVFDAKYYAEQNPDVVAVLGDSEAALFNHYITNGLAEGRDASATFNASFYALANNDLVAIYGTDINGYIAHYVNCGIKEGRIASINSLSTETVEGVKVAQTVGASMADSLKTLGSESTFATNYLMYAEPQFTGGLSAHPIEGIGADLYSQQTGYNWQAVRQGLANFLQGSGLEAYAYRLDIVNTLYNGGSYGFNTMDADGNQWVTYYSADASGNMVAGQTVSMASIEAANIANQRAYEANGNRTIQEIMDAGDTPNFQVTPVDTSSCSNGNEYLTVDDVDWGWDEE